MNDIDSNGGGLFFVYGYGGTSKMFVWRTLSSKIRRHGDIVLNVTSSRITSLLLLGGQDDAFKICYTTLFERRFYVQYIVLSLTNNLRLRNLVSEEDKQTVDWFSKWIADIGDGITGVVNDGLSEIDIPTRFLLKCGPNPIATIVENTFPSTRYGMFDNSYYP
ncbi:PREDICTED: uncharacterized protein LOC109186202 [Ipomoea nil]|uniref:uncharacterized protein LOC109186202 n=1 Tax=Ipomoea nil TaxID=35883 RepID=UPI00090118A5|nr:PREDICTED: uncharacterized protein LOC109186202 [Ipomoea nil]